MSPPARGARGSGARSFELSAPGTAGRLTEDCDGSESLARWEENGEQAGWALSYQRRVSGTSMCSGARSLELLTITIADRVWPAGETEAEKFDEPVVHLKLLTASDAVEALRESVSEVHAARPSTPEQAISGGWGWARLDDGVLVKVVESDDFRAALTAVADGLQRSGVVGSIDVCKSSGPVTASNQPGAIRFWEEPRGCASRGEYQSGVPTPRAHRLDWV